MMEIKGSMLEYIHTVCEIDLYFANQFQPNDNTTLVNRRLSAIVFYLHFSKS